MPVLESTDEITPRSVLRHRPIGDKIAQSGTDQSSQPVQLLLRNEPREYVPGTQMLRRCE